MPTEHTSQSVVKEYPHNQTCYAFLCASKYQAEKIYNALAYKYQVTDPHGDPLFKYVEMDKPHAAVMKQTLKRVQDSVEVVSTVPILYKIITLVKPEFENLAQQWFQKNKEELNANYCMKYPFNSTIKIL